MHANQITSKCSWLSNLLTTMICHKDLSALYMSYHDEVRKM